MIVDVNEARNLFLKQDGVKKCDFGHYKIHHERGVVEILGADGSPFELTVDQLGEFFQKAFEDFRRQGMELDPMCPEPEESAEVVDPVTIAIETRTEERPPIKLKVETRTEERSYSIPRPEVREEV